MKQNDWLLTISTAVYSYLFYQQSLGINFLIFNVFLIVLLLFKNDQVYKNRNWCLAAAGSILSAGAVFWFGDILSVLTNIISLMLLSAFSFDPKTSVITSLLFSAYSIAGSYVFMILDAIERGQKKKTEGRTGSSSKFLLYLIPLIIVLVFFFMYKASNPLFDNFTKKINLDFISAIWLAFTIGGFVIMYGFFYHKQIKPVANIDRSAPDNLSDNGEQKLSFGFLSIENERLSGIILFSMLNLLLLCVNLLDANFLWLDGTLPKDLSYSQFVHQGTGMLITSIIVAVLIILFYFRGGLNFHEKRRSIKFLAFLWIIQNAFMIVSTAYRNHLYINEYSLTYKRIGVYIYLLLTLIGLATTFIKIAKAKSNWFLFRTNAWLFYLVMLASCFVSWDTMLTAFNAERSEVKHKPLDKSYLASLSYKNIPQLFALSDTITDKREDDPEEYSSYRSYSYDYISYKPKLHYKLYTFLDGMQKMEWQSICIEKKRVYHELIGIKDKITELDLQNNLLQTIKPLAMLDHLRTLYFSGNQLKDLKELSMFPVLEDLYLSAANVDSLDTIPLMPKLHMLSIANDNLKSIAPLKNTSELTYLDLSDNRLLDIRTFPKLEKLQTLVMNNDYINDYAPFKKLPSLKELDLPAAIINTKNNFPSFPNLLRLNIQNNSITQNDTALFRQLRTFDSLTYLNIADNQLGSFYMLTSYFGDEAKYGAGTKPTTIFKSLRSLDVSRNMIHSLYYLDLYPDLEELYLSGNEMKAVTQLNKLLHLKVLNMDNCSLTDIHFLKNMQTLESLSLYGNSISDYTPLYNLKNLKTLTLDGISKQLYERLKKLLPNTTINAPII